MRIESAAPARSQPQAAPFVEELRLADRPQANMRPPLPFQRQAINICQVKPANDPHAAALDDVAELLYRSACEIGYKTQIAPNTLDPGALNILLGWHLLDGASQEVFDKIASCPTVIYQLEHFPAWIARGNNTRLLLAAKFHWDYSAANVAAYWDIAALRMAYIPCEIVPVGACPRVFHPHNDPEESERDIPVLFYGSMNARRSGILDGIAAVLGAGALAVYFGAYGEERDALIRRAKIVLNLHYYDQPRIFEQVRVAHALDLGAFVISEPSDDEPGWARGLVTQCRPDILGELCAMLLTFGWYRKLRRNLDRKLFASSHPMLPVLAKELRQVRARLSLKPSNSPADPVILPA